MEEAAVRSGRQPVVVAVQRKRRLFNAPAALGDRDAAELWNSAHMECRPFKDPNFDLRRAVIDTAVQAVPPLVDMSVQVCLKLLSVLLKIHKALLRLLWGRGA